MKEYLKNPFVKFVMVLISIILLAFTVLAVFYVVDEIRDETRGYDDDYYEYQMRKDAEMNRMR